MSEQTSAIQLVGAVGFGTLIGWYVYYINRYRKGSVQLSDLVALLGVLGGGTVLSIFPASTELFGAYGIGLAIGFFGYFLALLTLVRTSTNFDIDWFLDGRRKRYTEEYFIPETHMPTVTPMAPDPDKPPVR
jgi:hypothetical protein